MGQLFKLSKWNVIFHQTVKTTYWCWKLRVDIMPIFPEFSQTQKYSKEFQTCIEDTVNRLLNVRTNVRSPGMLLGKIQSGKTRTFMGIVALGFDTGFDICVILTKGTRALTEQTYQRLESSFRPFMEKDLVKVYDVMNLPPQLTPFIRRQKLIIIVKKETNNLDRLVNLFNDYPDLVDKKTLFIDDEADIASVGFRRNDTQEDGVDLNVLARKINNIRAGFADNYSFLQVTATPYSLYLQPRGDLELNSSVFEPIRPVFTILVPVHEQYIGGKQYFELSKNPDTVFSHIYIQVPDREIEVLGNRDQRYISNIFTTPNLRVFRQSIVNYLVAGSIRILLNQQLQINYKSSFVVHVSATRDRHKWQVELTEALLKELTERSKNNDLQFVNYVRTGYDNFIPSIQKSGGMAPDFDLVLSKVRESLMDGMVGITKVNSESQISSLLDRRGQLRLDNPFNIFIGGQILDRGLTIENFIGFFYGRNPNTFQQDTVLQHSRMYGSRPPEDIAVTRFYTTNRIYRTLRTIHESDSALREAFERGLQSPGEDGVIFIQSDSYGEVRPCAPNKILITSTQTIRPYTRLLPIGFQTKAKSHIAKTVEDINNILTRESQGDFSKPFLIDLVTGIKLVNLIEETFEDEGDDGDYDWDKGAFISIMRKLSNETNNPTLKGKIYCYAQRDRSVSRMKNNYTAFTDAPDDGKKDIPTAKSVAKEIPCLILLKENGQADNGWKDAPFWWPVLLTPANTRTAIFASETINLPES